VLLNAREDEHYGQAERVMATVFASWPAAMFIAPALGGLIADHWGIGAVLWIGALGFVAALGSVALAEDVRAGKAEGRTGGRALFSNRRFLVLAAYLPNLIFSLQIGFSLAPTYMERVRGYSPGEIGLLYSILSIGTLAFNYVVGKVQPQVSLVVLVGAAWVGTLLVWRSDGAITTGVAFVLWGAISTMWLLAQTTFGQLVNPQQRGLALGITETLGFGAMAVAAWLAGQLYASTPSHDLQLFVGAIAVLAALIAWVALPLHRLVGHEEFELLPRNERTAGESGMGLT
jgi:predicted MFS family arabinose efflux permease